MKRLPAREQAVLVVDTVVDKILSSIHNNKPAEIHNPDCLLHISVNNHSLIITRAPHAVPTLICQGTSFYLKYLVKKGHNS